MAAQQRPQGTELSLGGECRHLDEGVAVDGVESVVVDQQEVLVIGRAAQRPGARDAKDAQRKAVDVRHRVGLDVETAVGEADQGVACPRLREHAEPGLGRQVRQHLEARHRAHQWLAVQEPALAVARRRQSMRCPDQLRLPRELAGFVLADRLGPIGRRPCHARPRVASPMLAARRDENKQEAFVRSSPPVIARGTKAL